MNEPRPLALQLNNFSTTDASALSLNASLNLLRRSRFEREAIPNTSRSSSASAAAFDTSQTITYLSLLATKLELRRPISTSE